MRHIHFGQPEKSALLEHSINTGLHIDFSRTSCWTEQQDMWTLSWRKQLKSNWISEILIETVVSQWFRLVSRDQRAVKSESWAKQREREHLSPPNISPLTSMQPWTLGSCRYICDMDSISSHISTLKMTLMVLKMISLPFDHLTWLVAQENFYS
jgi:hypothetical protein